MHGRWIVAALLGVVGCYTPHLEGECEVSCASGVCPSGMECGADQRCFSTTPCNERPDASIDQAIDEGCVMSNLLGKVCPETIGGVRIINSGTYSTDELCPEVIDTAEGEVCLVAADSIVVAGSARFEGTRPLVLWGREAVVVRSGARIDVSLGGAGAQLCSSAPGTDQSSMNNNGTGGGAGGSFVAAGGNGGPTANSMALAAPPADVVTLRGGCAGGRGGNAMNGTGGGLVGAAGGGIALLSPRTVHVLGTIDAYGGGGGGAKMIAGNATGGGGGGSGGLIVLEALRVEFGPGTLLRAHGGGGGGGSSGVTAGTAGNPGDAESGFGATGGSGSNLSGSGGSGSGDEMPAGIGGAAQTSTGAGGGGGARGAILIHTQELQTVSGAQVHPPAT